MMDYIDLFNRHDAQQEALKKRLPCCNGCGEALDCDTALCIGDRWFCEDCKEEFYEICERLFTREVMLEDAV